MSPAQAGAASDPELDRLLLDAMAAAGEWLSQFEGKIRERELKQALREVLEPTLPAPLSLHATELHLRLEEWPRVGGVDLVINRDAEPYALVELKLGSDTLWHCAYDLPKMGLAARLGLGAHCFLIAAAPQDSWHKERLGPALFRSESWNTAALFAQNGSSWRHYQRLNDPLPLRLPDRIDVRRLGEQPFHRPEGEWAMLAIEVTAPGQGWLEFDRLEPRALPTGGTPERIPFSERGEFAEDPSSANRLLALEGGSVYLLGDRDLFSYESALPDIGEDLERISLLRFPTTADRTQHLRERNWLDLGRDGAPASFALTYSVFGRGSEIYFDRTGSGELRVMGELIERARPRPDAWQRFWETVEAEDPWSWPRWHSPLSWGTDGQFWSLLIARGGRLAHSRGYDAFPPEGKPDPAPLERIAAAALEHLFGHEVGSWGQEPLIPRLASPTD